jgi:hypothetical protein
MSKSVSIFCLYCHQHTLVAPATTSFKGDDQREYTLAFAYWQAAVDTKWWIGVYQNANCNQPVLVLNKGDAVYPQPMPSPTDERIPDPMRTDLMEAKTCFSVNAFGGCAVFGEASDTIRLH